MIRVQVGLAPVKWLYENGLFTQQVPPCLALRSVSAAVNSKCSHLRLVLTQIISCVGSAGWRERGQAAC